MKQTLIGLALGVLLSSVHCMNIQPAHADSQTKCTRDSQGRLTCTKQDRSKGERCISTCRKDSRGQLVCTERCQ